MLSVIVPTCNRPALLSRCLDSLRPEVQQVSPGDFELIVTDDSTDEATRTLIATEYPWVRWSKGPRKGPAANRNSGAREAKGSWLIFIDDDCEPDPGLLKNYRQFMEQNAHADVLEGMIYSDEHIPPFFIAPLNLTGGFLWSCNFAIKRSVFDALAGFDENYPYPNLEDNDLNKRLIRGGYAIVFAQSAKVYHAPRPIASPKKNARYHESWLYYHAKFGEKKTILDLLLEITRTRTAPVRRKPFSRAFARTMWLLGEELVLTVWNSFKWKKVKGNDEIRN